MPDTTTTEEPVEVVRKFTDTKNRTWRIYFDLPALERVREQCDYDPISICDEGCDLMVRVGKDPVLACASVYAVCEPDIKAAGLTAEEFGQGWDGTVWFEAVEVYFQALADFFPKESGNLIRSLLSHGEKTAARSLNIANAAVSGLDVNKMSDEEFERFINYSSNSAESAIDTPGNLDSVSTTST